MGKSSKTTQTNEPPAWARPLLEKSASRALDIYDSGAGYNVYGGPTQAPLSDATLGGMNSLLAATGYQGAPVSNEGINSLIPTAEIQAMIQQAAARNAAAKAQQPAAKPKRSVPLIGGTGGHEVPENTDFQRINASRGGR